MKFDCGPSYSEKCKAKEQWHDWFAWYPIRVGEHDCRWLETVRRKGRMVWGHDWEYEYKAKESINDGQ